MNPEELNKIITEALNQGSSIPWWTYLLFIVLPFIGSYIGAYSKKKGENLATKEDVNVITQKIESVKAEILLTKELEKQYLNKKLDLLISFFDHISEFHYELMAVNFGEFPSDEGKSLYEYQVAFYKAVAEITKSYQRLVVFITPDSQILHHAEQLTTAVISSRKILKKHFFKIKTTAAQEREAYLSGDTSKFKTAAKEADEASSIYWGEMKPTVEVFKEYFQKFITDLNEYVKPESKKA